MPVRCVQPRKAGIVHGIEEAELAHAKNQWHDEQADWHKARIVGGFPFAGSWKWHKSQYRWHMGQLPFSWIVSQVFKKHTRQLAANVTSNNALFSRLLRR